MGCSTSKNAKLYTDKEASLHEISFDPSGPAPVPLLLRLISASDLPSHDLLSESDVFVIAQLLRPDGKVAAEATWPVKWDQDSPIWDSCRLVGAAPPGMKGLKLRIKLFDEDEHVPGKRAPPELVGVAYIDLDTLPIGGAPADFDVTPEKKPGEGKRPRVRLQRVDASGMPSKKTLYIVRHGESVWNKAQAEKDVATMLSTTDHPLNDEGRKQAEGLRARLVSAQHGGCAAVESAVLKAERVVCSPLTRAVQTCLIGMDPLLSAMATPSVALLPNLREKRNLGGKDSSGKWVGEALVDGIKGAMGELYADDPELGARLAAPALDIAQVGAQWWVGSAESEEAVRARIDDALCQLRFSPESSAVIVGHSHYFREMLRAFCADGCALYDAAAATEPKAGGMQECCEKKLENAGVAQLDVDWGTDADKPIQSVRLLFGTKLVE